MNHRLVPSLAAAVLLSASASAATAALTAISLPGTTQNDTWARGSLTASANPGFPTFFTSTNAWPAPIGSPVGGDAALSKTANGAGGAPYPASASMYYGSFGGAFNTNGGTLTVTDNSPVANLATVVFQIEIGEAWTYDFHNGVLPTLSYNGGSQNLPPTYDSLFAQLDNGTMTMPSGEERVYINTYGLQWDVSALGPVTSFSITWAGVEHAQLYALQLDQGSQAAGNVLPAPVPEPSSLAFLAAGLGLMAQRRRR